MSLAGRERAREGEGQEHRDHRPGTSGGRPLPGEGHPRCCCCYETANRSPAKSERSRRARSRPGCAPGSTPPPPEPPPTSGSGAMASRPMVLASLGDGSAPARAVGTTGQPGALRPARRAQLAATHHELHGEVVEELGDLVQDRRVLGRISLIEVHDHPARRVGCQVTCPTVAGTAHTASRPRMCASRRRPGGARR